MQYLEYMTADNVNVVLDGFRLVQSKRALGEVTRVAVDSENKSEQVIDRLIAEIPLEGTYVELRSEHK
jgi:hypothetical protein